MIRHEGRRASAARSTLVLVAATVAVLVILSGHLSLPSLPRSAPSGLGSALDGWAAQAAQAASADLANLQQLRDIYGDNQRLRAQNRDLQQRLALLAGVQSENASLRRALGFDRTFGHRLVTAQVIGRNLDSFRRTLTIDRGRGSGVRAGMVVVAGAGLVGSVVDVSDSSATVQTLEDPSSRVSGYEASSGLEGTVLGDGGGIEVDFASQSGRQASSGDWVLTSGFDAAFPRGLILGEITSLGRPDANGVQAGQLAPAEAAGSLTVVQVITDFKP